MAGYRDDTEIKECARCGYSEFKEMLCIHHIDMNKKNNENSNKLVLCFNCHLSLHHGLWDLKDVGIDDGIVYTRDDGIKALQEKVATGEAVWNGRGKDKTKRNNSGYLNRWARYRQDKEGMKC
jgi:Zn ribbon nucleic-acid-binding protein